MLPKDWERVNLFDESLHTRLAAAVEEARASTDLPRLAAFDADGTLWDTDVGEMFFRYQIAECRLPGLPKDAWEEYGRRKATDYAKGCLWLAQINAGQKLEQVQLWARQCFGKNSPLPIFENMKRLIGLLQENHFEVFIVTASVKWAVEPMADHLGISASHVIGMETVVRDGIVTADGIEPLPYAAGKAKALIHRNKGIQPVLSAGNTWGDHALLECATHVRLAVSAQKPGEENFDTEMKLQAAAQKNGWFHHRFRE